MISLDMNWQTAAKVEQNTPTLLVGGGLGQVVRWDADREVLGVQAAATGELVWIPVSKLHWGNELIVQTVNDNPTRRQLIFHQGVYLLAQMKRVVDKE